MLSVDSNNNITLTRGDSALLYVDLYDLNDDSFVISEGDIIRFTVTSDYNGTIVIQKNCISPSIAIAPSDTEGLICGLYLYDIKLITTSGNVYTPIGTSEFMVEAGTHVVSFTSESEDTTDETEPQMVSRLIGVVG